MTDDPCRHDMNPSWCSTCMAEQRQRQQRELDQQAVKRFGEALESILKEGE